MLPFPKKYKYLVGGIGKTEENCLGLGEYAEDDQFINIRVEEENNMYYCSFKNIKHFKQHFPINKPHCCHEIITQRPFKLPIDVDSFEHEDDIVAIIDAITEVFDEHEMFNAHVIWVDGSGIDLKLGKWKNSAHLTVANYAFADVRTAQKVVDDICKILPNHIGDKIDRSIYTLNHSIRTPYSTKNGRILQPKSVYDRAASMLTCDVPKIFFRYKGEINNIVEDEIIDRDIATIINHPAVIQSTTGHQYRNRKGNYLNYNRLPNAPTYCEFCNKDHTCDNTVRLRIRQNDVVLGCQKSKDHRILFNYDDAPLDIPIIEELFPVTDHFHYSSFVMQAIVEMIYDVQYIRANMKMGKTQASIPYIMLFDCVVMISCRRTFTKEKMQTFAALGFESYLDIVGPIDLKDHPKIIIQLESIGRIVCNVASKKPDLIVLDESESIHDQFASDTVRNLNDIYCQFRQLMRNGKILCMDANLGNHTIEMIRDCRPECTEFMSWNKYQNNCDDVVNITTSEETYINELVKRIKLGENIYIPTNSKSSAKKIIMYLTKNKVLTNNDILFISSETPDKVKDEIFSNINVEWCKYKLVVYSPTCGAGISFTAKHFHTCMGYFTNKSNNVNSQMQMVYRVRDVSTKQYIICLPSISKGDLLTKEQMIKMHSNNVYKIGNFDQLYYRLDNKGNRMYDDTEIFRMLLRIAISKNKSANKQKEILINLFKRTGATVVMMKNDSAHNILKTKRNVKICDDVVKTEDVNKIIDAPDVTAQELLDIQADPNRLDKLQIEQKYWFRHEIDYKGVMTAPIVEALYNIDKRNKFKRIKDVLASKNVDLSLTYIEQKYKNENIFQSEYQKHKLAADLLKICGWSHIVDDTVISKKDLVKNITTNKIIIESMFDKINLNFDQRPPKKWILKSILRYLNVVFEKTYDCKVKSVDVNYKTYKLHNNMYSVVISTTQCNNRPYIELDWKYKRNEQNGFIDFE